jgi:hypothetical protein
MSHDNPSWVTRITTMWVNPGDISKIKFGDANLQTPVAGISTSPAPRHASREFGICDPTMRMLKIARTLNANFYMKSGIRAHRTGPVIIHVPQHSQAQPQRTSRWTPEGAMHDIDLI